MKYSIISRENSPQIGKNELFNKVSLGFSIKQPGLLPPYICIKRVVLTSSFGAVGYSHQNPAELITEENWTDPTDSTLSAYLKSKTLAESVYRKPIT